MIVVEKLAAGRCVLRIRPTLGNNNNNNSNNNINNIIN